MRKKRPEPFLQLSIDLLWLDFLLKVASEANYLPYARNLEEGVFVMGYLITFTLVLAVTYVLIRFLVGRWHRHARWLVAVWVAVGWYVAVISFSEAFALSALGAVLGVLGLLSLTASCSLLFMEPAWPWLRKRQP
jgi:hypothetical protein